MDQNQPIINAIATLGACIDPLIRAEKDEAITAVVEKILELVKKL